MIFFGKVLLSESDAVIESFRLGTTTAVDLSIETRQWQRWSSQTCHGTRRDDGGVTRCSAVKDILRTVLDNGGLRSCRGLSSDTMSLFVGTGTVGGDDTTVVDWFVFSVHTLLHDSNSDDKDGATAVVTLLEKLSTTPGITYVWPNLRPKKTSFKYKERAPTGVTSLVTTILRHECPEIITSLDFAAVPLVAVLRSCGIGVSWVYLLCHKC